MDSAFLLFGAVVFSFLFNKILLRFSNNFGVDSRQSQNLIRWSSTTKPTTGGISFYVTFLMGFIVLLILNPGWAMSSNQSLALLSSATLAFFIGFADDAYGTHPMLKFLGQILCGIILLIFSVQIEFFVLISPNLVILDKILTVFWVVGMMNSLNMLDNMDAVTATIAITILVTTFLMMILKHGLSNLFYLYCVITGGFAGFLFFNWRPAKIYMGDTGSMFIGMVLAFAGITYFWNVSSNPDNISLIRKALIPLMVFLVPIMDTTFVTFARLARGSSPFVGGKDHLTHNLARVGIPDGLVPMVLGVVSLGSGGLAIYIYRLIPEWDPFYSILFALCPIAIFLGFLTFYRKGTQIEKIRAQQAEEAEAKQAKEAVLESKASILPMEMATEES